MSSLRLKKLAIRGFRSIREGEITFPDSGAVLIDGKNLDTGGSSGSGKSSVLMAVAYAFGYCDLPATQLQAWGDNAPDLSVTVEFETDQGPAILTRGSKLILQVNGTTIKGSASAVETKLRELTGLSVDMLSALTYRAQKSPGLFINKTDSEKKEFLSSLLGLEKYEEAVETAQENVKRLQIQDQTNSALASRLTDAVNARIKFEKENPILPPVLSGEQASIDQVKNYLNTVALPNLKKVQNAIKASNTTHDLARKAIDVLHDPLISAAQSALADAEVRQPTSTPDPKTVDLLKQAQERLARLQAEEGNRRQALVAEAALIRDQWKKAEAAPVAHYRDLVAKIESQMAHLEKNICFECGQTRLDAVKRLGELKVERGDALAGLIESEELQKEAKALDAQYKALPMFAPNPNVDKMAKIVNKLQSDLAQAILQEKSDISNVVIMAKVDLDKAISAKKLAIADHTARRLEDEAVLNKALVHDQAEVDKLHAEIRRLQEVIANHGKALDDWDRTMKARAADKAQLLGDLNTAVGLAKKVEDEIKAEWDFIKLVGREGFLGAIFDEVLAEISEETNKILGQLPNAAHVSVRFSSDTVTQKGNSKRTIVPVISINGHEAPLKSGCSGGMVTSVELAVDLAVANVVSRRTGKMPGWLILDESFEGLDLKTKESCMELLKRYAEDKLVLVVDHATEFQESFNHFIHVQYSAGVSTIK